MDNFDTDAYKWQLDRMFGIWNSAIHEISVWIQKASTYRSTVVHVRVYKAFFHSKDFLNWAHKPHQNSFIHIHVGFRDQFELALQLYNEGSETSDDYGLLQLFNKSTHIHAVPSVAKAPFDPVGYQRSTLATLLSTPK